MIKTDQETNLVKIKDRQKKQSDIRLTYLDIPVCINIQVYRCTVINSNSLPDKHYFCAHQETANAHTVAYTTNPSSNSRTPNLIGRERCCLLICEIWLRWLPHTLNPSGHSLVCSISVTRNQHCRQQFG